MFEKQLIYMFENMKMNLLNDDEDRMVDYSFFNKKRKNFNNF